MPLYEYECKCGRKFEVIRRIEDRQSTICECGMVPELKLPRPALFIVAGPFKVFANNGTLLHERQITENSPPPDYRLDNPNLVEA